MNTLPGLSTHQKGERSGMIEAENNDPETTRLSVGTFGGRVHVEWNPQSAVTPLGQLLFFIQFLKLGDLFTLGELKIYQVLRRHYILSC